MVMIFPYWTNRKRLLFFSFLFSDISFLILLLATLTIIIDDKTVSSVRGNNIRTTKGKLRRQQKQKVDFRSHRKQTSWFRFFWRKGRVSFFTRHFWCIGLWFRGKKRKEWERKKISRKRTNTNTNWEQ
jgi:hypothetical protein